LRRRLTDFLGVVFPTGYALVNDEAPEEQPWRRLAYPRQYQDYFDEIYDSIVSLKMAPLPMVENSRHHRIVQGEDREGLVSLFRAMCPSTPNAALS
jgi:hypothetical protein